MKNQERQETLVSEFLITDKNGTVHNAILAGVLQVEKSVEDHEKTNVIFKKDSIVTTTTEWSENVVFKSFTMGLAITNPTDDTYSLEYGTRRAVGRALKPAKMIGQVVTSSRAMLGRDMCTAIMNQQIAFIQGNQDLFLKIKATPVKLEDLPF
jgi:hypothetical protein